MQYDVTSRDLSCRVWRSRLDTVCRACRVLQEVGALPLRRARAELLQPCGPVLQPLLQRLDLLLRQRRRALREARHLDHLLGHEGLHLRQRRMDLRCLFVVCFLLCGSTAGSVLA